MSLNDVREICLDTLFTDSITEYSISCVDIVDAVKFYHIYCEPPENSLLPLHNLCLVPLQKYFVFFLCLCETNGYMAINYRILCGTNKGGTSEGLEPWNHLSSRNIYYYLPQRRGVCYVNCYSRNLQCKIDMWLYSKQPQTKA